MIRKISVKVVLFICIWLSTLNSAHADFRKAIEALQRNDGPAMLAEVKDAVEQKNDDGLILFLNALAVDYRNASRKSDGSNLVQAYKRTIFEIVLTNEQQNEVRMGLDFVVENGLPRAQWILLNMPYISHKYRPHWLEWQRSARNGKVNNWNRFYFQELRKIAENGSVDAAGRLFEALSASRRSNSNLSEREELRWAAKAVELGDPYAARTLGFKYLNWITDIYPSHAGCESKQDRWLCLKKDISLGRHQLKEVVRYMDKFPLHFAGFMYEMGNIELSGLLGSAPNPRQASLWYLLALNSLTNSATDRVDEKVIFSKLEQMKKTGQLKLAMPELDAVWDDAQARNRLLHPSQLPALPEWIDEARTTALEEEPVFSMTVAAENDYAIEIYEDGRVVLGFLWNGIRIKSDETYTYSSPRKVKEFIRRVNKIGIADWPLSRPSYGKEISCMSFDGCSSRDYVVIFQQGKIKRSVFMSQASQESIVDNIKAQNISQLLALVEEFYPTSNFFAVQESPKLIINDRIENHYVASP